MNVKNIPLTTTWPPQVGNIYIGSTIQKHLSKLSSNLWEPYYCYTRRTYNDLIKFFENGIDRKWNTSMIYVLHNLRQNRRPQVIVICKRKEGELAPTPDNTPFFAENLWRILSDNFDFNSAGSYFDPRNLNQYYKVTHKFRELKLKPETEKHFGGILDNI